MRFGERGIRLPAEKLTRFIESQRRAIPAIDTPAMVERPLEPLPPRVERAAARPSRPSSNTPELERDLERLNRVIERSRRPSKPPPAPNRR